MLQRWSSHFSETLRTLFRRGVLFVFAALTAVTITISPIATRPANAQLTDLLSMTSFTNGLSSCAIETVGWVICPTMRSIAKLADYGFTYINKYFLRIDYTLTANNGGTYKAWEIMRNIANGLFVVAFMVLIYSQLTGRASGGYNIKRLLPRLIIAAIAVNVSYYLCVALIDLSNILGDAILWILKDQIADRVGTSVMPLGKAPAALQDGTLTVITSSVMAKAGVAWVLLAPVAAVIVSIATITAAGLVLLIMRKTVIAMLILASPILFVAYLLPNTERFFSQGARLFLQLLMIFPIVAMLLGAGQIVSATIVTVGSNDANYRVSGDTYFARNGGSGSAITDLTAAGAAVLPLLGVWFLFKNMSSIMSTAGSRLSATVRGRRGEDKEARVTGKATAGAANAKNPAGMDRLPRRQAFSRNRRRSSLGGSSLLGEEEGGAAARAGLAARNNAATQNALDAAQKAAGETGSDESAEKRFEELRDAQINGGAEGLNVDSAAAEALAAAPGKEDDKKQLTAKDLFNNMNRAHESKDKERKLGAGPAPAGGGSQAAGGSVQPTAPSASYRAPQMAQSGNIVSGSAPSQQPTKIVAVPVQIDASSLLGQNQNRPPENVAQPPISGTEEKAKARAQKYLFDADKAVDDARSEVDILGRNHRDAPTEAPHTTAATSDDKEHKDDSK